MNLSGRSVVHARDLLLPVRGCYVTKLQFPIGKGALPKIVMPPVFAAPAWQTTGDCTGDTREG